MSARDPRAHLYDMAQACAAISELVDGRDLAGYSASLAIRMATERAFITLGEAGARLAECAENVDEGWAVPLSAMVGLRNVLVHGYFRVDEARIFETATQEVPRVARDVQRALLALGGVS